MIACVKTVGRAGRFVAVLCLLAGCVAAVPETVRPLSAETKEKAINAVFADKIVENCPDKFRSNWSERGRVEMAIKAEIVAQGSDRPGPALVDAVISKSIGPREAQERILLYIKKRDIVIAVPDTWCRAGDAEMRENSEISKYLVRR